MEVVALLITHGADIDASMNRSQKTALMSAVESHGCRRVRVPMVRLLLEAGADPNTRDFLQETPLMKACDAFRINAAVIRLLVQHGADVNARDKFGDTALSRAVSHDVTELVRLLIQLGAKQ